MIRRLINRIQGRVWGARCLKCSWTAGRTDLKLHHASNLAMMHTHNSTDSPHVTTIF